MNKMKATAVLMIVGIFTGIPLGVQAYCNADITTTKPDSRYTDNGDGTVTDTVTGLMWKQCSEGQSTTSSACDTGTVATYTWQGALQQAEAVNSGGGFAGHTDWRLPNHNELTSLVEWKCYYPAINTNLFPATPNSSYWSSTPMAGVSGDSAWVVGFSVGSTSNGYKIGASAVRLVRGGQ